MNLLFARHGQASFGQDNYDKLSSLGERQAKLLGKAFASQGRHPDVIVTGTMVRQQESAKHFLTEFMSTGEQSLSSEPTVIEGFDEFNHQDVLIKSNPAFANRGEIVKVISQHEKPKIKLAELFDVAMTRWHAGENDGDYFESWTQFNTRVWPAVQKILSYAQQKNAKNVMVFTSGGVIACIASQLLSERVNSKQAYRINRRLVNTGVTTVMVKKGFQSTEIASSMSQQAMPEQNMMSMLRLLAMNEHSHLYVQGEKPLLTWY